jgi:2-dehydro-3-deoxygluconokinase
MSIPSTSSDTPAIVALGEAMIEFNQSRADTPDVYLRGYGGDTSNMAIAASRLLGGARGRVGYVTRVGADAFGRMLLDLWRDEGVDTRGVAIDSERATGVYFVTHGAQGHEFSYLRAGSAASHIHPDGLPEDVLRGARILHVSGISQAISASACDAAFAAIDIVRAAGGAVSYDPNLRPKLWPLARARAIALATLERCDYFLPGLDEGKSLTGQESARAIADWCHERGARVVVMKSGADGLFVSDGERLERIAGIAVTSVDATGAGDCFDGAFAVRMLAGDDPFAAARYANAAAAIATTGFGAVAPLPRDAAVQALLARNA